VAELIAEAERVLALATEVRISGPVPPRPTRAAGAKARWSGDGIFMQAILAPHVRGIYGAELTGCRVVRSPDDPEGTRVRYDLRGSRDGAQWRVQLEGIPRAGSGARSALERLDTLGKVLDDSPGGLRLPRPVAYLGSLSLSLCEPPQGDGLESLIQYPEALTVADRLAEGLARLHAAPVQLSLAPRALDEELRRLRGRLEGLAPEHAEVWTAAAAVMTTLQAASLRLSVRFAPTLRTLRPKYVVWDGSRVGVQRVDDITVASPLQDVADFLARCVVAGTRYDRPGEWDAVAGRFRETYLAASHAEGEHLVAFEAAALLRLACERTGRDENHGLVRQLIETAEARLATGDLNG
jgi:hypothetical protein